MRMLALLLAATALPVLAGDPTPEITRGVVTPQAVNALHTLRQIPEACARLEGMFTGDAAQPYKFSAVRTSPKCQARARFVDAAKVKPSEADGWKFNDLIRVPNAGCRLIQPADYGTASWRAERAGVAAGRQTGFSPVVPACAPM